MKYLMKLYRGELSLAETFWLWFVLVGLFFTQLVLRPVLAYTAIFLNINPTDALLVKTLIQITFLIFVSIGAWKASKNYNGASFLGLLTRIFLILFSFILIYTFFLGFSSILKKRDVNTNNTTSRYQEWAVVETPRGDIKVLLPYNPVYESDQTPDAIESYSYIATSDDGSTYIVKYENFSTIAEQEGLQLTSNIEKNRVLKAWADGNMEEFETQNLTSEFISVKGYPAIQYTGNLIDDGELVRLRSVLVLIDKSIYSFYVLVYKDNSIDQLDRVINSVSFKPLGF